jgi:hypothetical protein
VFGTPSLELGDFQAVATRTAVLTILNASSGGWYSATLPGAVANTLINKLGPTQFRLRFAKDDDGDRTFDRMKFYSGNALAAFRPQLRIQYYLP